MPAAHVDASSRRFKIVPTMRQRRAARLLANGVPIKRALVAAGYSEAQARKGVAAIRTRAGLCQALVEEGRRWTPEARAALVRGRLIWNVIHGVENGVRSAKLLGSEKDLSMWESDTQRGLVMINAPSVELVNKAQLLGTAEWNESTTDDKPNSKRDLLSVTRTPAKSLRGRIET
jgi:hypothetical protein